MRVVLFNIVLGMLLCFNSVRGYEIISGGFSSSTIITGQITDYGELWGEVDLGISGESSSESYEVLPGIPVLLDVMDFSTVEEMSAPFHATQGIRIDLAPNPASDKLWLTFDTSKGGIYKVKIYDSSGRLRLSTEIETQKDEKDKICLSLDQIHSGVYFLYLEAPNIKVFRRFVVLRQR